jgi:hypothetical protein
VSEMRDISEQIVGYPAYDFMTELSLYWSQEWQKLRKKHINNIDILIEEFDTFCLKEERNLQKRWVK